MIVSTMDSLPGRTITRTLGLVRGNTIRARHIGRDIGAILRHMAGGELREYTKMMAESREQAIDRMIEEAERLGANAIVGVRFTTRHDDERRRGDPGLRHGRRCGRDLSSTPRW